jgi:glucose-6-phosphate 1-dehydrogenase
VQFKDPIEGIFNDIPRNELVLRIQPDEAIYMKMNNKIPGFVTRAIPVEMDLTYDQRFKNAKIPQAYEALILDALKGDHSNFVRDDELDYSWKIFTPILHWIDGKDGESLLIPDWCRVSHIGQAPHPEPYKYGSRGPEEIDNFIAKYGFTRQAED